MKKSRIMDMVLAGIVVLMGILIIIQPEKMLQLAITVVGVFLIVVAVLRLLLYMKVKNADQSHMIVSVIYLVLGIVFLVFTGFIMTIAQVFAILFSILLMISLLIRVLVSWNRRHESKYWLVNVVVSLVFFVASVFLMVYAIQSSAEVIYQLIGILILIEGLIALLEALFPPKVIVVEYHEVIDAEVEE